MTEVSICSNHPVMIPSNTKGRSEVCSQAAGAFNAAHGSSLSLSVRLNIHAIFRLAMTCTHSWNDSQDYKLYCIAKGDVHESSNGVTHLTSNTFGSMT